MERIKLTLQLNTIINFKLMNYFKLLFRLIINFD